MELRQVEYFLAVVDHEGIGGAATALSVAQPTVSQSLRRLERELGVELFHRIGRGMTLSAAGRSMVGPARRTLRDVDAAQDIVLPRAGALTGRLDILAFPAIASGTIVDLVARFRARNPRVAVRYGAFADEQNAAGLVRDGHCEFVVAHLPLDDVEGVEVFELGRQEYWLAYPPGTDLPDGPVALSRMPDIPMIFAPHGSSVADEFAAIIRRGGSRPPVSVLAEHREVWLPLVMAGVGGTLSERALTEAVADRVVVRPTDPPLARPYGLVFPPERLSPVGRAFVELVRGAQRDGA